MDSNKGQTIFLSVIGIATLLVAIIGATFAWFSVTVTGNENASSIIVRTATLGNVVFTDGVEINLNNIKPELEPSQSKTFYIENVESQATEDVNYEIFINVTSNTLTEVAEGQFVHSMTGQSSSNTGTLATTVTNAVVPAVGKTSLGTGMLHGFDRHTYDYVITFRESSSNQNAAQGKEFRGTLSVEIVTE